VTEEWNPNELIGTHVGTCVLERPLGVGGMGAVYLARQLRPRRQVAVKLLRPRTTADPREWSVFLARFRREADATAALDHANIVPIYEFGEDGTLAYLVMPYLPDGSLGTLITREGRLPVGVATSYLEQAAAALECAHRHGIIHRDVKPSNLLLHPDGRLMLADFGIARPLDKMDLISPAEQGQGFESGQDGDAGLTQAGVAMGTPEYMAPEQIRGEAIGPATDIYALGMVAYAMLTGHTPFAGTETTRILARQVNEPPRPLRLLRPDVPPHVERAVLWALAKNPADRPRSGPDFANALRSGGRPAMGGGAPHRTIAAAYGPPGSHVPGGPAALADNGDATLYDGNLAGDYDMPIGGAPVWPGSQPEPSARRRGKGPFIGCLAAVALVLACTLLLTNLPGWLAAANGQLAGGVVAQKATPTPTATATPTPSPTPTATSPANWLSASPGTIKLGCGSKRSATVTLSNLGSEDVQWYATVDTGSFGGQGIQIQPQSGKLDSGEKAKITITNNSLFFSHQGTIQFVPNSDNAGQPAATFYQTQSC
jgi:hypothetical protein